MEAVVQNVRVLLSKERKEYINIVIQERKTQHVTSIYITMGAAYLLVILLINKQLIVELYSAKSPVKKMNTITLIMVAVIPRVMHFG